MKNSLVIAFAGGTYGTYLHWTLHSLTNPGKITAPWSARGTSHRFNGTHHDTHWRGHLQEDGDEIVRLHPKGEKDESLVQNLNEIASCARKIIHLYPDPKTYLLVVHNFIFKIWHDIWQGPLSYVDRRNLYEKWPIDPNTPVEKISPWILREFFSLNLFTSWEAMVEWYLPDHYPDSAKHQYLPVSELLFDYKNTMERLQKQLDLTYVRSIDELIPYHMTNLANQQYLNQQDIADKILKAVMEHRDISWSRDQLTIYTESWIQRRLRELGYELKCHGLDLFPDNSVELKKLLYQT